MEYTVLGNSNLKVSKVCLGCMGFGKIEDSSNDWHVGLEETKTIIKYALDQGINFFDTARGYGNSEKFLGIALKEYAKRENIVVATKFLPMNPETKATGISYQDYIEQCVDTSLENLGMDYIDLYIYHIWDFSAKMEDIMEGLNRVVQKGKVKAIGISNCFAYQLAMCNEIAKNNGWAQFVSVQGHYNLIHREEEREMARFCRENNIAMTPYSGLAAGRLAKHPSERTARLDQDKMAISKYDGTKEADSKIISRVIEIAEKRNVSMAEVALSWLMSKVASPVVGVTKLSQIDALAKASDLKLTEEENTYLEELYVPHQLVGVMSWYK